jgi:hypothetical protein
LIRRKTILSKYTILENHFNGLAANHLLSDGASCKEKDGDNLKNILE